MPILDPVHDRMHPVEGDAAWSESYYFNAYDPDGDVGFYTRIGIRPNEGQMDVSLALWLPGGEIAFVRDKRDQSEMCESPLEVGGVRYECLALGKRWRLSADADARIYQQDSRTLRQARVELDCVFDALIPLVGVDGQSAQQAGASASTGVSTGKGHLEQSGRFTGTIRVAGVRHALGDRTRGSRDKSWGPRRWEGPRMWRWFSINIADDIHFGGIRIGTDAGDLHRGWVWKDGEHTSLSQWRVRTETEDDGITQKKVHVTAVDKRGREYVLTAELLRVFPGGRRPGRTLVNEGLARWHYEGATGYGIAEYLHQFDEDGNPKVPIE